MKTLIMAATLLFMSNSVFAVVMLNVDNGQLLGASGVNINNTRYDVEFRDGTCVELFSGCDQNTDFTFQSEGDANTAAQALLDFVFIDGPEGNFDSVPNLTNGIQSFDDAFVLIPYLLSEVTDNVFAETAENRGEDGFPDIVGEATINSLITDTTSDIDDFTNGGPVNNRDSFGDRFVFALFSETPRIEDDPTRVPEPSTLMLMSLAMLGFVGMRRKQNKNI